MEVAFDPLYEYITTIQSFDKLFDLSKKNKEVHLYLCWLLSFLFSFFYILTLAFSAIVIGIDRHLSAGEVVLGINHQALSRYYTHHGNRRQWKEREGNRREHKAMEGKGGQWKAKEGIRREQGRKDGFAFRRCNWFSIKLSLWPPGWASKCLLASFSLFWMYLTLLQDWEIVNIKRKKYNSWLFFNNLTSSRESDK